MIDSLFIIWSTGAYNLLAKEFKKRGSYVVHLVSEISGWQVLLFSYYLSGCENGLFISNAPEILTDWNTASVWPKHLPVVKKIMMIATYWKLLPLYFVLNFPQTGNAQDCRPEFSELMSSPQGSHFQPFCINFQC